MYCSNCGNKLRDTDKFCSGCGVKVISNTAEPVRETTEEPKSESKKHMVNNKCDSCGAMVKKLSKGHFQCEYCGSEYFMDESGDVTANITEKEIFDVFCKAAEYETNNQYQQELQCLLSIADKASDNILFLVKLGRAYRRNSMYNKAVECYEKTIKLNPEYPSAYSNLGAVYIFTNEYVKAEYYCKKGIELAKTNRLDLTDNDYAVLYSNCAIAVGKQGKKEEAKRFLKIAEDNGYKNGDAARKMIGIKKGWFG